MAGQLNEVFPEVSLDLTALVNSGPDPVLVEGPSGCGKSSLLLELAHNWNKRSGEGLLYLHMGEQIDGKSLLGTFSSTGSPGDFTWKRGVLTKAVESGAWVIFEDIDSAPADVISLLLPLVKSRQLLLPGHTLRAASDFRLFLTQRVDSGAGTFTCSNICQVLRQHCAVLQMQPLTAAQKRQIITAEYPDLSALADSLVSCPLTASLHIRKLLKLCKRVCSHVSNGRLMSEQAVPDFMLEVVDCLCGHLPSTECLSVAMELQHLCGGMSKEKIEHLCKYHRPVLRESQTTISIGRAELPRLSTNVTPRLFAPTRNSLALLEKVCVCVAKSEPVLLVGETGVGKTATISHLAQLTGIKLVSMNMSQQTDSVDLLGGFKPIHLSQLLAPVRDQFDKLFFATFSGSKNKKFLEGVQLAYVNQHWRKLLNLMSTIAKSALSKQNLAEKRLPNLCEEWKALFEKISKFRSDLRQPRSSLAFAFVEGALVEAVRCGHWILLDEINLATPETLQCLSSLLEGPEDSFVIPEKPDQAAVSRSAQFRLFCCMNPATDVGKKQLPHNIRNRFTELFVEEMQEPADLQVLVRGYLNSHSHSLSPSLVNGIIKLYQTTKLLADSKLQDGTGRKPHYSLRSLCRALVYASCNSCGTFKRSLFEGFCLTLLSELRTDQHSLVRKHIQKCLEVRDNVIAARIPRPHPSSPSEGAPSEGYREVGSFWLHCGPHTHHMSRPENYILTESVKKNLKNLCRAISARSYPILLQGPTSAGKTSMIQYVAGLLGHKCLRVNNHEHTDLQEYVGAYTTSERGELFFQEGVLVTAMREGHWIILDELNLAPTEVLEALNRVLDDNRELFIPETQELVKGHPNFMLFGTQNPPGTYGGRKVLSRAFRNRFIELHFEDIPSDELKEILCQRCKLPESYSKKMVKVMKDLQVRRSTSGIFAGKYGLITLRDLFRWGERYKRSCASNKFHDWDQQLAEDGFMLLGGRLRESRDQEAVLEVIEKHFKRVVTPHVLFGLDGGEGGVATRELLSTLRGGLPEQFQHLVWTEELLKMAVLVYRCLQFDEPVLLVGNTGCGKTSLCQLLSVLFQRKFYSINCHMHTEAADFLGGLRPTRNNLEQDSEQALKSVLPFEWVDGVVVMAMKEGGCLLVDEISLADDAVLERLNSILELERKLVVSERSRGQGGEVFQISASQGFQFLATMNPGGDYGKKELSPALRNRFVEIWCASSSSRDSFGKIIRHNLSPQTGIEWSECMLDFLEWLKKLPNVLISVRDILTWVQFMNITTTLPSWPLTPAQSFLHGAHLVFLDALGSGAAVGGREMKVTAGAQLRVILERHGVTCGDVETTEGFSCCGDVCGIEPFMISRGSVECVPNSHYSLEAPGTRTNVFRLLRAMQLGRPLLLEGPPGVGKTSLVSTLAQCSGHAITRINLSEQTDIADLFGSDLPVEGKPGWCFQWRDGPFLKALKSGDWIMLDEMNLASQSVLEGLNACLDHRGEIYVPELGRTFKVPIKSRIFVCQNPLQQGGGRKGLPKSFLNRFTQVYIEPLSAEDLLAIVSTVHPDIDRNLLKRMITFTDQVATLFKADMWEFNLRDFFRWCELMTEYQDEHSWDPGCYVELIFLSRLRDSRSRNKVRSIFREVFNDVKNSISPLGSGFCISSQLVQVGQASLERSYYLNKTELEDAARDLLLLHSQLPVMEALVHCIRKNWMAILVGSSCSGKSSVVQCLASLAGQKLLEFPMSSETDTIDLLGGFEQVNLKAIYTDLTSCARDVLTYITNYLERNCDTVGQAVCSEVQDKITAHLATQESSCDDKAMLKYCSKLSDVLRAIEPTISFDIPYDISGLADKLQVLMERIRSNAAQGQFEWVDNVLVKALEQGHWLLISHANFCSPSVLDRLNGLLEPGGVLRMDERGVVGDDIKVITPHPNFRLFLTMDPVHSEISRAMRNRGVEIFVPPEMLPAGGCYPEDTLSLMCSGGLDHSMACQIMEHCKIPSSSFQLKRFGRIYEALEKLLPNKDSVLARTNTLCGFQEERGDSNTLAISPLLTCQELRFPLTQFLLQPTQSIVHRDSIPLLHQLSLGAEDTTLKLGNSLLSGCVLVFLCCSTSRDKTLRLSVLTNTAAQLEGRALASAELQVWCDAMNSSSVDKMNRHDDGEGSMEIEDNRVPSWCFNCRDIDILLLQVLAIQHVLVQHVQLSSSSMLRSPLTLSHEAYEGRFPVEGLLHQSLLYLEPCLQTILTVVRTKLETGVYDQMSMNRCVDWVYVFITICMTQSTDFSSIACAWALTKTGGLTEFSSTLQDSSELEDSLKYLTPLEDMMRKNSVYLVMREAVGFPDPPKSSLLQLRERLRVYAIDKELLGECKSTWPCLLSGEELRRRADIVREWSNSITGQSTTLPSLDDHQVMDYEDYAITNSPVEKSSALVLSPLMPAIICLRDLLVSQLGNSPHVTVDKLDSLVAYLIHIPGFPLSELEPVLMWRYGVDFKSHVMSVVQCVYSCLDIHQSPRRSVPIVNQSVQSPACFQLLTPQQLDVVEGPIVTSLPVMTIGNHKSKRKDIKNLLQFLWLHGSAGTYSVRSSLRNERQLLQFLLEQLVTAISAAIGSPDSIPSLTAECVSNLCSQASSTLEYMSTESWLTVQRNLCSAISYLMSYDETSIGKCLEELDLLALHSHAQVCMGVAQVHLLCPSPIDPIVTARTRHQCLQYQVERNSHQIEAWNDHYLVMVGRRFTELFEEDCLPAVLRTLMNKQKSLVEELSSVPSLPDARESKIDYRQLSHLCTDLVETLCTERKMQEVCDIHSELSWKKVDSWSRVAVASLRKMKCDYAAFSDVVLPFSAALTQVVDGLNTMTMIAKFKAKHKNVAAIIQEVAGFPAPPSMELCAPPEKQCVPPHDQFPFSKLLTTGSAGLCDLLESAPSLNRRLTVLAVSLMSEHALSLSKLRKSQYPMVDQLLEMCWTRWQEAEEERRRREKEEQSLYRYRTTSHEIREDGGEGVSEGVEEEVQRLLVDYSKFMAEEEEGEGEEESSQPEPGVSGVGRSDEVVGFSEEEMQCIARLHLMLYGDEEVGVLQSTSGQPLTTEASYSIAGKIALSLDAIPGLEFDKRMLGAHINMCGVLLQTANETNSHSDYNIYKDPAPSENSKALKVLEDLMSKVEQFLSEWPEHPTLTQITKACSKVLSLDINSPLMKVLAGLEYILKKAQDWEDYASSRVSLGAELQMLKQLVMEWRRKELGMWKNYLQLSKKQVVTEAYKWWFHLYDVCREQCRERNDDKFIVSLQEFMESSQLGEFSTRLHIVRTFLKEMELKSLGDCSDRYLGNILMFYSQFGDAVEQAIQKLVEPVEKDFKSQLSIVRWWNDGGNYWDLKRNTEKSHRAILRLREKYKKEILQQPVRPVLTECNVSSEHKDETLGLSSDAISGLKQLLFDLGAKAAKPIYTDEALLSSLSLVEGVSLLDAYRKMMGYIADYAHSENNVSFICSSAVDDITSCIVQTMRDLQSDDYLKGLDPDKRKAAIGLKNLQKRNALKDLFKALKQDGLSCPKRADSEEDFRLSAFKLPHQELPAQYHLDKTVNKLWEKMQSYYYRCIAQMAGFQASFQNPTKELMSWQILSCKGYVSQLMFLVSNQRTALYECTQSCSSLQHNFELLESLIHNSCRLASREKYQAWLVTLGSCAERSLKVIRDFTTLVKSMPESLEFSFTPHLPEDLPPITRSGDRSVAQQALSMLKECSRGLNEVYLNCVESENKMGSLFSFVSWDHIDDLDKGFETINCFVGVVSEVILLTGGETEREGVFEFLSNFTRECRHVVSTWQDSRLGLELHAGQTVELPTLEGEIDSLVGDVFLGVQQRVKRNTTSLQQEQDDMQNIREICSFTAEVLSDLRFDQVLEKTERILSWIPFQKTEVALEKLKILHPILAQYMLLHDRAVKDMMVSHCTLCKLLSILLSTFTTLVSKGFCTPPEEAEASGSGQGTDFVDMEAGGFDEGQGETNVSNDAQPENIDGGGQGKEEGGKGEEEQKRDDDDAIEMSEDFEGDVEDVERDEEGEDSEEDEENTEEADKEMGDLGSGEADQLDRNMWAPEEQEDKQSEQLDKQESGGGTVMDDETRIVAKDDEAGAVEEDQSQSKDRKDVSGGEDGVDDESVSGEDVNDYQQPDFNPSDVGDNDLGDLSLEDMNMNDQESDVGEAETEEAEQVSDTGSDGEVDELRKEADEVQDMAEDERPPSPDKDMWTVDQTSYSGVDTSAVEDKVTNTDTSGTTAEKSGEGEGEEEADSKPSKDGQSSTSLQKDVEMKDEERGAKRPNSANRSEYTLANNEDERIVKKPKLMEPSTTSSKNPETEELKDSTVYRHLDVRSEDSGDAVAWDAAPPEYNRSSGHLPPPPEQAGEEEEEEEMDTSQADHTQTSSDVVNLKETLVEDVSRGKVKEHQEMEGEEESDVAQEVLSRDHQQTESYFHTGAFSQEEPSLEDAGEIRSELISAVTLLHSDQLQEEGALDLWLKYESLTFGLSQILFEELRLILLPTKAAQLKGDFRTGKRLNMRRIIPYIASNFQNNRIWLRRSKPSQREYQVLLAVDDSSSMHENQCIQMAYESLALVSSALNRLEAGQIGVCRFGESVEMLHPLDQPFTASSGATILQSLSFTQPRTNFVQMLRSAYSVFSKSRQRRGTRSNGLVDQLLLILSDGRGVDESAKIAIRQLTEIGVFCVFIVLDSLSKNSICDIQVPIISAGKPFPMKSYLELFPFNFYIVLRDVKMMPHVLSQALRQWFEIIADKS